jgi:hypothetical protein
VTLAWRDQLRDQIPRFGGQVERAWTSALDGDLEIRCQ